MPIEKLKLSWEMHHTQMTDEIYVKINELIDFINTREQDRSEQMARVIDKIQKLEYELSIHAVKICELEECKETHPKKYELDLLPCVFCNSSIWRFQTIDLTVESFYKVRCCACSAEGPEKETKPEAIQGWNNRA